MLCDKEILIRIAKGDQKAFEILALKYADKVFFYALTYVKEYQRAEELAQDIFLKIWQYREKLETVENFDKYLFVVSKHLLISAIRKKLQQHEELNEPLPELYHQPDKQYEQRELAILLDKGLNCLPEQKRAVFKLIYNEGLSQEQVSERLGIAKRTVRWNLVSAVNLLRDFFHKQSLPAVVTFVVSLFFIFHQKK